MTQPPITPGYQSRSIPPQGPSGLATAALVVGIVGVCFALVLGCIPFFGSGLGGLFGIVAIVLGLTAINQGGPASAGRGRAGLILGIITLVVAVSWHFAVRAGLRKAGDIVNQKASQLQQQIDADR